MKYVFTILLLFFPKIALALTLGIGTSAPTYFLALAGLNFGLSEPYGLVHFVVAKNDEKGLRAHLGLIWSSQKYFALSWRPSVPTFHSHEYITPVVGVSAVYDSDFQRMTDESRHIEPDINLDTYLVADWLVYIKGNIGVAFSRRQPAESGWEFEFGYVATLKTIAKNLHKKEIRNCYFDKCPDGNNKSGGGQWPDSPHALYANLAYMMH